MDRKRAAAFMLDQPKLLEFVHEDVHARARGSDHVCEGPLRDPRQRRLWIGLAGPNAGKGRPKGSLNKATADVRAIAQSYTEEAILTLVALMRGKKTPPLGFCFMLLGFSWPLNLQGDPLCPLPACLLDL
jgi:hypothetical protein